MQQIFLAYVMHYPLYDHMHRTFFGTKQKHESVTKMTQHTSPCCIDVEAVDVKGHHGQQVLNKCQLECEAKATSHAGTS